MDAFLAQDLLDGRPVYALQTSYRRHLQQRYLWLPEGGLWRVVRKDPASALLRSAEFGEAVRWLRSHDKGGSVIASPFADSALRVAGVPRVLPAATEKQLAEPGALPPDVLKQATDVRRVYRRAKGDGVVAVLERYDVRYLVLVKKFEKNVDGRKDAAVSYNRYRGADDLYRVAFENEQVIVYEVPR